MRGSLGLPIQAPSGICPVLPVGAPLLAILAPVLTAILALRPLRRALLDDGLFGRSLLPGLAPLLAPLLPPLLPRLAPLIAGDLAAIGRHILRHCTGRNRRRGGQQAEDQNLTHPSKLLTRAPQFGSATRYLCKAQHERMLNFRGP
jgi:hypothetical protein